MKPFRLLAPLSLLLLALASPPALAETVAGTAKVVEGDTIDVNGTVVRLFGIDAPDRGQTCQNRRSVGYDCFALASVALERLMRGRPVSCAVRNTVGETRIGVCTVDGRDLAALMVRGGWALAYRRVSQDYVSYEADAAGFRRGMWAGRVEPPWVWRSRQMEEKRTAPPTAG